jgi:hypothetical protein
MSEVQRKFRKKLPQCLQNTSYKARCQAYELKYDAHVARLTLIQLKQEVQT